MPGELASILRAKLAKRNALPVPGCYDALSARVIEAAGFEAVQVSSFGLAGSLLARPDAGLVDTNDILNTTWKIARAVRIPVVAEIGGAGSPMNTAEITARLIDIGAAGVSIEDRVKCCGHMQGGIVSAAEMAGKVQAMADARVESGADILITVSSGACAVGGLEEAIRRANGYLRAGADMVCVDGIASREEIARAAREIHGLLAVNLMDGPACELARMGIAQAGIPTASILAAHRALMGFFTALRESGTGVEAERLTGLAEYNAFVGLPEQRALEERYLEHAFAAVAGV
jgi:methylisocitrate lyase